MDQRLPLEEGKNISGQIPAMIFANHTAPTRLPSENRMEPIDLTHLKPGLDLIFTLGRNTKRMPA
ncbi:hypothetical protein M3484_01900 [Pseudomonas sp. GX19020]|uniref:hypothetical protein n=1 Tax=Pseudomonas sp. GX19020 TaxID=2942277 RepID=UPI00201A1CBC|nr:hypothetical protein [Pseudomonas sp. GX19020]MCL4065329.1 hypothetical protein [Pseudomonas sp. GX19020]